MSNYISSKIGGMILSYAFRFKINHIDNVSLDQRDYDINFYRLKVALYKELYRLGCEFFRE